MAKESGFVEFALKATAEKLPTRFTIVRGKPLLYELKVSDNLEVLNPEQIKSPSRGSSAFQTDLCVFERVNKDVQLPRVVIEFKTRVTTHDVLTYSAKAERHKRIYPYLRYGLLASDEVNVPGRAFTHNESLDFIFSTGGMSKTQFVNQFIKLLRAEIKASRLLQDISNSKYRTRLFRLEPIAKRSTA